MRIGINVGNVGGFPSADGGIRACLHLAEQAERLGFDSVWVSDQVVVPAKLTSTPSPSSAGDQALRWDIDTYEALTLLSALAQKTRRVEVGVATLTLPLRHPLMTAKMLATADQLSGGRVIFGAGAGWMEEEFAALGVAGDFPRRDAVTEDYVRAIKEAWLNTGPSRYIGDYVQFAEIGTFPHPVRQPHIPIWIGGTGTAALKRAVRLGSGYIGSATDIDTFGQTVAELRRLAEQDRRDPDELTVALAVTLTLTAIPAGPERMLLSGTAEQITDDLRRLEEAGLQHVVTVVTSAASSSLAARLDALAAVATDILPAVQTQSIGGRA